MKQRRGRSNGHPVRTLVLRMYWLTYWLKPCSERPTQHNSTQLNWLSWVGSGALNTLYNPTQLNPTALWVVAVLNIFSWVELSCQSVQSARLNSTQLNRMSFSCDPVFIWPHDVNTVCCDVNIKFNIVYLFYYNSWCHVLRNTYIKSWRSCPKKRCLSTKIRVGTLQYRRYSLHEIVHARVYSTADRPARRSDSAHAKYTISRHMVIKRFLLHGLAAEYRSWRWMWSILPLTTRCLWHSPAN